MHIIYMPIHKRLVSLLPSPFNFCYKRRKERKKYKEHKSLVVVLICHRAVWSVFEKRLCILALSSLLKIPIFSPGKVAHYHRVPLSIAAAEMLSSVFACVITKTQKLLFQQNGFRELYTWMNTWINMNLSSWVTSAKRRNRRMKKVEAELQGCWWWGGGDAE